MIGRDDDQRVWMALCKRLSHGDRTIEFQNLIDPAVGIHRMRLLVD